MKRIVIGDKKRIADWVSERTCGSWEGHYEAIGLERDGHLVAGAVVDGYISGARCSVHCASAGRHWLTRGYLRAVFRYMFEQLGCNVVLAPVSSANTPSIRFTRHCGFVEACRIKGGCIDGDLVIFELQRENCSWIGSTT